MRKILLIAAGALLSALPAALSAQSSESRYNREFVFVDGMYNLSLGASPTIMGRFMHPGNPDARTSVAMPPVHLMFENCFWDMGNGGSIGWGLFFSHGKYTYAYDGANGRGGDRVNVRTGMTQMMAGGSYHYTIRTRLEVYARLMVGGTIDSFKSDRAGSTHDMDGKYAWNGVAGMRWFFSNTLGVYAEGGYTSGCVNAGITCRW